MFLSDAPKLCAVCCFGSTPHSAGRSPGSEEMNSESSTGGDGGGGSTIIELEDDNAPLWKYVRKLEKFGGGGNWTWQCNYCHELFKSSHTRVKAHLLHIGLLGIKPCRAVKREDVDEMRRVVEQAESREKVKKAKSIAVAVPLSAAAGSATRTFEAKKRRAIAGGSMVEKVFDYEARDQLNTLVARMFYSAGLPFQLARNPYFIRSFLFAANNMIPGYVPPGESLLRTSLLQSERLRIENMFEPIRQTWREKGVSIVTDGWSDPQRKPIVNVMAVSEDGSMFLSVVNTEGKVKDESYIADVLIKTIQDVGSQNVVQVLTDSAPVCKAAGLLVEKMYPHIFWTPCVVHTLNASLKNICRAKNTEANAVVYNQCRWINDISVDVLAIRDFIVKHPMKLSMYNHHLELKLLAIPETRFASGVVMLRRFKTIKRGLQDMVISEGWTLYKENAEGIAQYVKQKVLDDIWWDKIDYIVSFTEPIYDMLRSANTDKPNLHLVYDMWDTMIEKVKNTIYRHEGKKDDGNSAFYSSVHSILIDQWNISNTPLHCLAHSLNPKYYSTHWLNGGTNRVTPHMDVEISNERAKCLKRYFSNAEERRLVNTEFANFSAALGAFADDDSLTDRGLMDPKVWWIVYGAFAPRLQGLALKLLGQPCSSSGCERNWSTYSLVHSMKRNKMNPKQAEDLVYVHTNLRLLSRKSPEYFNGETKMWDIGGDDFDSFEGLGILEVADLSLDEPELECVVFGDDENDDNTEVESMEASSN